MTYYEADDGTDDETDASDDGTDDASDDTADDRPDGTVDDAAGLECTSLFRDKKIEREKDQSRLNLSKRCNRDSGESSL